MMKVRDYMQRTPRTVTRDLTLREAASLFALGDVVGLPVVEDGTVVGLVTRSDMLKLFIPEYMDLIDNVSFIEDFGVLEPESFFGMEGRLLLVEDVMRDRVPDISPDSSLLKAVVVMEKNNEDLLVVTEKNRIMGILTRADICRAFFGAKK
jgi:predicted transcriptional regulator